VPPGSVVEWLGGTYVLGLSEQAKRDIVRSQPWTDIRTTTRAEAAADLATYQRLVVVARRSDLPWLSDPAGNPMPACYIDGSCLPNTQATLSDSVSLSYSYWILDGAV
jgi:hypothetical protein